MDGKEMHIGDVVAFRTIDGEVDPSAAIITSISRNGKIVELMIPDLKYQEVSVDASSIEKLSAIGDAYGHGISENTIEMYENISKIYGETAKMLREIGGTKASGDEKK